MDGYKYLSEISKLRRRLDSLLTRKRAYERMADSIPTHPFDEPVVQKSKTDNNAPFVKWIDKILNVDKDIKETETELKKYTLKALGMIGKVKNPNYQNILVLRYVNEMAWEDIAMELDITRQTCWRWHIIALSEFEKENENVT